MANTEKFIEEIEKGYTFKGKSFVLGGAMLDKTCQTNTLVRIPLKTLNRHGLIAGATGSGKTKTLQIIAEQLSNNGVPVLLMDVKGDLSGIAVPSAGHPKIDERHEKIGIPFEAAGSPIEFLSLSGEKGARLRATVSEFGPVLFSKIMDLNDTQSGVVAVIFKYCDDNHMPLLDLKDFKKVLQYVQDEGKDEFEEAYGRISSASTGAIMRKVVELEQQGADIFFGERSFDPDDLCRVDENGKGIVSIVRLTDIQDRPKLFSTFMLQLLAEVYSTFPEEGDLDQPKLVIFIDEAHLVFEEASKALQDQIEAIVKLIRSKGVGLFFVTQNPTDVPDEVLSQLGMKVQHALRAFTAKDRKAIKLTAENYPLSEYYKVDQVLTELGIGEALITVLNEKGIPTPLVHSMLRAPQSRMDVLTDEEIQYFFERSKIAKKYNEVVDRESAYELLTAKIEDAAKEEHQEKMEEQKTKARKSTRAEKTVVEKVMDSTLTRQIGRTVARELTRGILGVLGVKSTGKKSSSKSWFW
ncbi:MAG: helicase HerA-like domain-containing protein [Saprospiraceae bacterium]